MAIYRERLRAKSMVPSLAGLVAVLTTSQTRAQENCGESIIADICIMIDRTGWPAKSG